MDALTAARAQMEVSLGFHMVFAALGIGMPLLMLLAEGLWLKTGKAHYQQLARTWGKATALLFAIGAVSGTALSFELGLLWPRFMAIAGAVIGPAFALEAYAFFIEAIFVGLYLYGWDRLSARAHWLCGLPVAISGLLSGVLVVAANAWMQHPVGVEWMGQHPASIDAMAIFRNPYWWPLALHLTLACYVATGFSVAGVYAVGLLRGRRDDYHRSALSLAVAMAAFAAIIQLPSGDWAARNAADRQPAKLAAMEAHFETARGVGILIGGLPDERTGTVRFGIRIPRGLSLLTAHDPNAEIRGLYDFPADQRPNTLVCHLAFQVMVGAGFALLALSVWYAWAFWRRRKKATDSPWLLRALVVASPLGMVALEAGWIVTEVGRQPWAIYQVLRTRDAVTPAAYVTASFMAFTVLYLVLGTALVALLRYLAIHGRSHRSDHDHHMVATEAGAHP